MMAHQISIGENRGTRAAPAHAVSLQATANCPRSGSKEGRMQPGRPGRSLLALFANTARQGAVSTYGQMPRSDRDRRGQAESVLDRPGAARGCLATIRRTRGSLHRKMCPGSLPTEITAGWSSPEARQAHNLKVGGSNPSPASNFSPGQSMAEETPYQQPSWMKLLFSSKAEIDAADPVDRERYYQFVEAFSSNPEACGFSAAAGEDLLDDDFRADMRIAAHNQEG